MNKRSLKETGKAGKKGIIFDMDGTMFDTESIYQKGWELMAYKYNQTYNPQFQIAACGTSGEKMIQTVYEYYPQVDAVSFIHDCMEWVEAQVKIDLPEKPGLHEILNYAKNRGWKMAVASSSKMDLIVYNLKKAGIYQLFDAVASGEEVEHGKPEPDIFLLASSRLGLDPSECYVIEDGANGVKAGAAARCDTIMVPDIVMPDEELRQIAAGIYETLTDVVDAFEKNEL